MINWNVLTNLSNLKSKLDKLDDDKLVPVPVDLGKLNDVLRNNVVRKDVNNVTIKNIEEKTPNITNFATKTTRNAKIDEVKGEMSSITKLATKNTLNTVENKIPSVRNLVKKTGYNRKINETGKKIIDHKYITTSEFNKLTSKNFAARLKQADLASKSELLISRKR